MKEVHQDYRLFLSTMTCDFIPASFLHQCLKLTFEPVKGLKRNMQASLSEYQSTGIPSKLTYSLALLHAAVQERRKFGALGWNVSYDFNQSDLSAALSLATTIPEHVSLQMVIGDIVYGGRVTDEADRRVLKVMIEKYLLQPEKGNNESHASWEEISARIASMHDLDAPDIFGMQASADLEFRSLEANQILECVFRT